MASDVKFVKVGDHCTVVSGFAFKSKDLGDIGIPVIKIKNVNNKTVDLTDTQFFPKELISEKHNKFFVENGDVLIAMTGQGSVGRVGRLNISYDKKILLNQRVGKFSVKKSLDLGFLYYVLSSDQYENILFNAAVGSGQPNLSPSNIYNVEIPYVGIIEQKAIAHILGSLDEKIELNRQMNKTLEAMAQALFKSWFVDFDPVIDNALAVGNAIPDVFMERAEQRKGIEKKEISDIQGLFPDTFEFTEEMGWIPEGWKNGTLADICCYAKGKINTSELNLENYVSTENMNKEKAGISYAASIASTDTVPKFSVGQTLISNIRPYFKKIWLASFSGGRSNDVLGFQANDSVATEYLFSLLYQDSFFDYMTATSKGTKMPRGDKAAIMSWSIAIPPLILMEDFSKKVKPIYLANQIRSAQAISLSNLRDTLLPKLMSGELRIPDAALLVDDVL